MTNSMTTPIATVTALAAVTLFMIVSLLTVGAGAPAHMAMAPVAAEANG